MSDLLQLIAAVLGVLAVAYVPGYLALRVLGGSRLLALGIAPAIASGIAGISALLAPFVGLDWSLLPFAIGALAVVGAAWGLRALGVRLPGDALAGRLAPRGAVRWAPVWIVGALGVALGPILVKAGRADAVLERWDTLYHLSALRWIRDHGTASSLDLGAIAHTDGTTSIYPAAFHALATTIPGVEVPILLNGAVLALSVLPWVLGLAILARVLYPEVAWAPFATAVAGALVPAAPWDEWIHLSAIPNLCGFAMLPGALAAVVALWQAALVHIDGEREHAIGDRRAMLASLLVMALAAVGLALLHPNVAVTALILCAVLSIMTLLPHLRRRPWLLVIPGILLAPVAALVLTPLGAKVTGFVGGLQVSWWSAIGEIGLGLLTVWPMAIGVALALLWWPGLVTAFRRPHAWVAVGWIAIAILYYDAAIDSTWNLSTLWYRGQDRLAMPLAMMSMALVVPGLQFWHRRLGASLERSRALTAVLVVLAVLLSVGSVDARLDNAAKNLEADYPGRGRFLQADERELFDRYVPQMDSDGVVLASPYSGAAQLYALYGQAVRFPVGGMSYTDLDRDLIYAVEDAATDPESCALLMDNGIRYVYQEWAPYYAHKTSDSVNYAGADLGTVLFETDHSRMIEIQCDPDDGSDG